MNFKCNDCGFTADIPEARNSCPMCGSSDVVCEEPAPAADSNRDSADVQKTDVDSETVSSSGNDGGDTAQPVSDGPSVSPGTEDDAAEQQKKKKKKNITLTDPFFDKTKQEKEQEELRQVLQEVSGEKTVEETKHLPKIMFIAAGVAVVAGVIVFLLVGGDEEKSSDDTPIVSVEKKEPVLETQKSVVAEEKQLAAKKKAAATVVSTEKNDAKDAVEAEDISGDAAVATAKTEESSDLSEFGKELETPEKTEKTVGASVDRSPEKKTAVAIPRRKTKPVMNVEKKRKSVQNKRRAVRKRKKKRPRRKPSSRRRRKKVSVDKIIKKGHDLLGKKQYSRALHQYKFAARVAPGKATIYKYIGITYASMKRQKKACRYYRLYISKAPSAPDRSQVEKIISNYCE